MDNNEFYQLTRKAVIRYFVNNDDILNPSDCDKCLAFLAEIYFEYGKHKENL